MMMLASELRLFPEQASTIARHVDIVYFVLVGLGGFFGTAVALTLVVFAIRYRASSNVDRSNRTSENTKIEVIWTVIPLGLAMAMFVWGASVYVDIQHPPDGEALEIYAVGKQWMWKFEHRNGVREINELHVPLGRPVKLVMSSQDVIHSFFVPAFRIKQDLLPGRMTFAWFQATKTGEFQLFCAEYCGTEHSHMEGKVTVMEPSAFERWLRMGDTGAAADSTRLPAVDSTRAGGVFAEGAGLFETLRCSACHRTDSTASSPAVGPVLEGVYGRTVRLNDGREVVADEQYIIESILDPQARLVQGYPPVMPTFRGQITEAELMQLVAFLKSLSSQP